MRDDGRARCTIRIVRSKSGHGVGTAKPNGEEIEMTMQFVPMASRDTASRLKDLREHLGDGDAAKAAIRAVSAVIDATDVAEIERLQRKYAQEIVGNGPNQGPLSEFKYLDIVYWTYWKYRLAKDLGLDQGQRQTILDIGCGAAHFAAVCKHLGHDVTSLDIEVPVYNEISNALGVSRTIVKVQPNSPLPNFSSKFSLITAIAINFHNTVPHDPNQPYWNLEKWAFLLNDLISNQLLSPGRIWFWLNEEYRGSTFVFNPELLHLCGHYGAGIDRTRGIIDWKLQNAITVHV